MKTLLLTAPLPADVLREAIHRLAPDADLVDFDPAASDAALAGIEAVLAWQLPAGLPSRLPRLRWVCGIAAGVDKLLVPDLAPQVPVSRIVDLEQADGIAQFVALMALRHARELPRYASQQARHEWRRWPVGAARHRVAVLGMGTMGRAVARVLAAVGFEVEGFDSKSAVSLAALLSRSRIVVCALPLTPETEGLLDATAFAAMPEGAYLINIARGAHVVEADLIAAVRSGRLAGAALDVQRHEPMDADDPLWDVPGITITPHIAAQSSPATIAAQFVAGLGCLARGEPPPQQVDRRRGY